MSIITEVNMETVLIALWIIIAIIGLIAMIYEIIRIIRG
jgi:hypothetical protein